MDNRNRSPLHSTTLGSLGHSTATTRFRVPCSPDGGRTSFFTFIPMKRGHGWIGEVEVNGEEERGDGGGEIRRKDLHGPRKNGVVKCVWQRDGFIVKEVLRKRAGQYVI